MVSINLGFNEKCCADSISDFCDNSPSVDTCKSNVATVPPHLMLKIITNSEIYESFSEPDDPTDSNNDKLKGIEVLRSGYS